MKDFFKNGALILLAIVVVYLIFLRECKKPSPCPPVGSVLIPQKTWDSIQALADKPPIIKIKKEYIKGDTVYIIKNLPVPVPDLKDTTILNYHDSLKNENIDVWIDFRLHGTLLDHKWGYVPITKQITLEKIKYVPQIVEKPISVLKNGYYFSGLLGGRAGEPIMVGVSLDLITKKDNLYGLQYQRLGNLNFYSIKIGAKLKSKK